MSKSERCSEASDPLVFSSGRYLPVKGFPTLLDTSQQAILADRFPADATTKVVPLPKGVLSDSLKLPPLSAVDTGSNESRTVVLEPGSARVPRFAGERATAVMSAPNLENHPNSKQQVVVVVFDESTSNPIPWHEPASRTGAPKHLHACPSRSDEHNRGQNRGRSKVADPNMHLSDILEHLDCSRIKIPQLEASKEKSESGEEILTQKSLGGGSRIDPRWGRQTINRMSIRRTEISPSFQQWSYKSPQSTLNTLPPITTDKSEKGGLLRRRPLGKPPIRSCSVEPPTKKNIQSSIILRQQSSSVDADMLHASRTSSMEIGCGDVYIKSEKLLGRDEPQLPLDIDRMAPALKDKLSAPTLQDVNYILQRWTERWAKERKEVRLYQFLLIM
ncbi:hypothetical protein BSKO_04646 [Bryopsis sp. KO-2023]|nr:hypothetical protein BSKO_04646 [Bryopsis sp. KO-2023]